ncbi:hypothetical protein [Catenulispora rubra]|uniref:hypothetical protein n=1 Tax=Catenulispora rubra TaxID=280293 RepID=UPI001892104C|nr:hypothetical protein [Catenulispora rubra]
MIRTVRRVALLTALTFTAVAGPVSAATTAHSHVRHQQTVPAPIDPSVVDQLVNDVLGALGPVVQAVLSGVDDALSGLLSGLSNIAPTG